MAETAGLRASRIAFSPKALENWHNILDLARVEGRVPDLLRVARADFPQNDALRALEQALVGPVEPPAEVRLMRLYVTVPERVVVQRPFTVAVALRQPDSPELAEPDKPNVIWGEAKVEWPLGEESAELSIRVSSPDCITERGPAPLRLVRGEDSRTLYATLTPTRSGPISIEVDLDQDGDLKELVYLTTTAEAGQSHEMAEPHHPAGQDRESRYRTVAKLRAVLARLYPEDASILRLAREVGLNPTMITWDPNRLVMWHEALTEAEKEDRLLDIIRLAARENPDVPELAQIEQELLREAGGPQADEPPVEGDLGKRPTEDFPECCAVGDRTQFNASGVLIAPQLVLTARSVQNASRVFLRGSNVENLNAGEVINVVRDMEHPELDLRALFLERAASVAPRPVAMGVDEAPPTEALFVGFGTIDVQGTLGYGRKRYVRLLIASLGCETTDDAKRYGCQEGRELVAGGEGRDSSTGDAGGPLYVAGEDGSYALLATCSRGARGARTTAGDGGIYVRIDRALDWLRGIAGTEPGYRVTTVGGRPDDVPEKVAPRTDFPRDAGFMRRATKVARPVCRIVLADGSSATGFLTAGNLLITNHHVLPDIDTAAAARIEFNYETDEQGRDLAPDVYRLDPGAGFATSPVEDQDGDDWTAVRVKGEPTSKWGALPLVALPDDAPRVGDEVTVIGHPGGGRKQIKSSGNVIVYADSRRIQYVTDTPEGSSGSPVFDMSWRVIGLHQKGGWQRQVEGGKPVYANQAIHVNVLFAGLRAAGLYEV